MSDMHAHQIYNSGGFPRVQRDIAAIVDVASFTKSAATCSDSRSGDKAGFTEETLQRHILDEGL